MYSTDSAKGPLRSACGGRLRPGGEASRGAVRQNRSAGTEYTSDQERLCQYNVQPQGPEANPMTFWAPDAACHGRPSRRPGGSSPLVFYDKGAFWLTVVSNGLKAALLKARSCVYFTVDTNGDHPKGVRGPGEARVSIDNQELPFQITKQLRCHGTSDGEYAQNLSPNSWEFDLEP